MKRNEDEEQETGAMRAFNRKTDIRRKYSKRENRKVEKQNTER